MTDSERSISVGATRRTVVGGIVGLGVSTPLLAACGSDDTGSGGSGGSASGLAKTSDIPVGSGKIFKGEKVLVSQPEQGTFKAFSTVCTHQQCAITKLDGDEIECNCHFSRFSITDGANTKGPNDTEAGSVQPLKELKVTVSGDSISVS